MDTEHHHICLSVKNVDKRFGKLWANHAVSLTVSRGEICGLLGPNGAGKTTLLRLCAGWLEPDNGCISIMGVPVCVDTPTFTRYLGIVSPDAPHYEELTVLETLKLQGTLHGMHGSELKAACQNTIASFSLSTLLHSYIRTLSTGMRQRVRIACALLHSPPLLLMDEPTAGLDPSVRKEIWSLLRTAARADTAIVMSTHYFEEAAQLCDSVHVLVRGSIAYTMTANDSCVNTTELENVYIAACENELPYISPPLTL